MKVSFARFSSLVFALSSLDCLAADAPFTGGRWIDLTHEFSAETLYWPTAEKFTLKPEFHGQTPKGYFYAANRFRASEHGGTHIDAPIHFAEGHKTLDQLPIEQLIGAAIVVDVSAQAQKNPDYHTASIDYGQSSLFESHRILFAKNIPAFENVAALDQLPPTGAYIIALPMKIKGGSGGPLRIVAWVPAK